MVTEPLCVSTPPASYARMAMVRLEPDGMVMVPDARPPAMGMLNVSAVGMSAPVTSATKVRSEEHTTALQTRSDLACRPLLLSIGSLDRQDPSPSVETRAAASHRRLVQSTR